MSEEPDDNGQSRRRRGWWLIAALVGVAVVALAVYIVARPDDTTTETDAASDTSEMDDDMSDDGMDDEEMPEDEMSDEESSVDERSQEQSESAVAPGVYRDFSEDLLAAPGYERNILFVHAPWCPECRAFEQSLTSAEIPDGVQFLKIDYDSNRDELKQTYEVDIQSTFVEVDDEGEKVSLWVGYGKDRSLDAIFDGLSDGTDG